MSEDNIDPIKPIPTPYLPEEHGYVDVVAPCDCKVFDIKDVPLKYVHFLGIGFALMPDDPNMQVFMNGDVVEKDDCARSVLIKNPTFGSAVFFQAGIYMKSKEDENTKPSDCIPSIEIKKGQRVNKGEHLMTVDFKKIEKERKSKMCVIVATYKSLDQNKQLARLDWNIIGKHVKAGTFLFTFVKRPWLYLNLKSCET